jgi:cell division protein FtsQ
MIFVREYWLTVSTVFMLLLLAAAYSIGMPFTKNWMQEASRQTGFLLSTLTVSGTERTPRDDVLALLDLDVGMPLMAVDLGGVQARIEALPWVRRATVTRVLPGKISINIEERVPFALWQRAGKLRLIDNEGVVITRRGLTAFSALPMIVGEGAPDHITALYQTLSVAPKLAGEVKTLVRVGERRWDIIFNNGIRLKLPDNSDPTYTSEKAWKKFIALEAKHRLLAREVSVIDMRIADRLIMRVTPAGRARMAGKEWAT